MEPPGEVLALPAFERLDVADPYDAERVPVTPAPSFGVEARSRAGLGACAESAAVCSRALTAQPRPATWHPPARSVHVRN